MNTTTIQCWKVNSSVDKDFHDVIITYPNGDNGHDLITCLTCGELFAVNISVEKYVGPPLDIKLRNTLCSNCGSVLHNNYAKYPDTYIHNGIIRNYERPLLADGVWKVPDDRLSYTLVINSIYDE